MAIGNPPAVIRAPLFVELESHVRSRRQSRHDRIARLLRQLTPSGLSAYSAAEAVCVKYGPCPLDLATFECTDTPRSSFVRRVGYDAPKRFMAILLKTTWYPYCEVDAPSVQALISVPSVGSHYNRFFRSQGSVHGPFDCRDHPLPKY